MHLTETAIATRVNVVDITLFVCTVFTQDTQKDGCKNKRQNVIIPCIHAQTNQTRGTGYLQLLVKVYTIQGVWTVVCLTGGEQGTSLGPLILGAPFEVFRVLSFIIFGDKPIIHSYNILRSRS